MNYYIIVCYNLTLGGLRRGRGGGPVQSSPVQSSPVQSNLIQCSKVQYSKLQYSIIVQYNWYCASAETSRTAVLDSSENRQSGRVILERKNSGIFDSFIFYILYQIFDYCHSRNCGVRGIFEFWTRQPQKAPQPNPRNPTETPKEASSKSKLWPSRAAMRAAEAMGRSGTIILYYIILYSIMSYYGIMSQYGMVQYGTVRYSIVYYTIVYYVVEHHVMFQYIISYSTASRHVTSHRSTTRCDTLAPRPFTILLKCVIQQNYYYFINTINYIMKYSSTNYILTYSMINITTL